MVSALYSPGISDANAPIKYSSKEISCVPKVFVKTTLKLLFSTVLYTSVLFIGTLLSENSNAQV